MKTARFVLPLILLFVCFNAAAAVPANSQWYVRWRETPPPEASPATYFDEDITPSTNPLVQAPVTQWAVVALDFQRGLDLSTRTADLEGTTNQWLNEQFPGENSPSGYFPHYHPTVVFNSGKWKVRYHHARYPLVTFGSSFGGTPLYTGQAYRYAIVGGTQFVDKLQQITIQVIDKSSKQLVASEVIDIPVFVNSTPSALENWKAFGDQGYERTVKTSAFPGGPSVLETSIQWIATQVNWEQWGAPPSPFTDLKTYPVILTHKALDSRYGFVVQWNQPLFVSGIFKPWTIKSADAPYPTPPDEQTEAASAPAYAFASEDLPAWGTTLLKTPHFQGKPLPAFYQGKSAEEIEQGAPAVEWGFGSLFEGIYWKDRSNTTSSGGGTGGTDLTKTSVANWDAWAIGEKVMYSDGQVQGRFKGGTNAYIGLDPIGDVTSMDYALRADTVDNKVHAYANGVEQGAAVTYTESDVFTLERQGVLVRALKNGDPFHAFTIPSISRLKVGVWGHTKAQLMLSCRYRGVVLEDSDSDGMEDVWEQRLADLKLDDTIASIASVLPGEDFDGDGASNIQEYQDGTDAGSALSTLDLETVVWLGYVNTTGMGTTGGLKKTAGTNGIDDAGAIGSRRIISDGKVIFKASAGGYLTLGLNAYSQAQTLGEIDFAVRLDNTGASIYESNVFRANLGEWNANTTFEIRRTGGVITYHKDGARVYTSSVASTGTLLVDTAFYNLNSELAECRLMTGDKDADGMLDTWELALLPSGTTLQDLQNFLPAADLDGDGVTNLREYLCGTDAAKSVSRVEAVSWTSLVNTVSMAGGVGGLQKNVGGSNYNADAVSAKKIIGDGRVVCKGVIGSHFLVGLNAVNGGQTLQDLDYAIHPQNNGTVGIYEAGTLKGNVATTWNADTVFEIRRTSGVVSYYIDGALVYQSATASFGQLLVDTSFYTEGSGLAECFYQTGDLDNDQMLDSVELASLPSGATYQDLQDLLPAADLDADGVSNLQESREGTNLASALSKSEAVTWTSHVNTVSLGGGLGGLQKNAGANNVYDADAVSNKKILGDGRVIFKGAAGSHFLLGLNPVNVDRSHADLDYAMHPQTVGNTNVGIYQFGPLILNVASSWTANTVFEIRRTGTTIDYFIDGVRVYQSTVKSYGPLLVDTAFYTQGSSIAECRIVSGDLDGDQMLDSWELAALPADATLTDLQNFLPTADLDSDGRTNLQEYQDGTGVNNANSKLETIAWTGHRNTQAVGTAGGLQKNAGAATAWDSDAVSTKVIAGDGRVRFRFAQNNMHVMVGLSSNNASATFQDLEYAIYGSSTGALDIYEMGTSRGATFGNYVATDVFEIKREGTTITYWKNGTVFYTSTVPCPGPLMVEGNIYNIWPWISEASYSNATVPTVTPIQLGATTTELLTLDTSPELRVHPTLDALVEDLGRNPMALANFVLNEIELTDAIAYNERGQFEEASVNDGGVNRNALGVYLERQGSPTEQCALLVYLLRRAGYPATCVFPKTNTVKLLDSTLSKLLRMRVSGALSSDGVSDVPHEVPVNYPWVAVYVEGEWVHLFPWLKDTQIVEGRNFWSHIAHALSDENDQTKWIDSPLRWTRNYLQMREPAYDTQAAKESPLETLKRKFQDQLDTEGSGLKVEDFGCRYLDRKHNYSRWKDFPRPWSVDPTYQPDTYPTFRARGEQKWGFADGQWDKMFDTVTFTMSGQPGSGTTPAVLGPLRLSDLHNRRAIFRSYGPNATFTLQEFRPGTSGTGTFSATSDLLQPQSASITDSVSSGFNFETVIHRHREVAPASTSIETFLGVRELQQQRTMSVARWDVAAWCLNSGRVTPQMLRVHAEQSWSLNQKPAGATESETLREILAYMMGMSYHQRCSEGLRSLLELCKLSHVSERGFGFGLLSDRYDPATGHSPEFPSLDMAFVRTAYAGNGELRPDAGGQNKSIASDFWPLASADGSALEHLTINRFFPQENTDAISTISLLHRAKARPAPNDSFVELSASDFVSKGNASYIYTNPKTSVSTTKSLRDWIGTETWSKIETTFAAGAFDREFARVFVTPGPISGAKGDWKGIGTFIMNKTGAAAIIGQSQNGAYGGRTPSVAGPTINKTGWIDFGSSNYAQYSTVSTVSPADWLYASSSYSLSFTPFYIENVNTSGYHVAPTETRMVDIWNDFNQSATSIASSLTKIASNGFMGLGRIVYDFANLVSDPVNALTGEFYVDAQDLALPGGMPLEIRRNYSSRNNSDNTFGYGWMLSMVPYLQVNDAGTQIQAAEMNGNVICYTQVSGNPNKWEVTWDANPELMNTQQGKLRFNVIERSVVGSAPNEKTYYKLKAHDGSVREYLKRPFTIPGSSITRERPYLHRWYDHAGNYFEFTYYEDNQKSDFGQLRRIASSSGQSVVFYYDPTGHVTEIAAGDGRRIRYAYNAHGDLTEVVRPDGTKESYEYALQEETASNNTKQWLSTHLLIKETKPEGRVIVNEYEKNPNGTYADTRRVVKQLSNVGRSTGNPTVDQPAPATEANEPAVESYEPRLSARFNYSNLVETTLPDTSNKKRTGYVELFDAYDRKTVYHYVDNQLVKVVDPLGYTQSTEYFPDTASQTDPGGFRRSIKRTIDKRGLTTDCKYDANGNQVEAAVTGDLDGNPLTTETAVSTTQYNSLHLPWRTVAPNPVTGAATGVVTEVTYGYPTDPYLPTETKVLSGSTVLGRTLTSYVSVGSGQVPFANALVSETKAGIDGDFAVTSRSYNRLGLVESQTQFSGVAGVPDIYTRFRYNARHELEEKTDVAGRKTVYAYDEMGRRIWEERLDETGKQVGWSYVYYNQNGDVEWTDGPRFAPEDYTYARYDGMGRAVEQVMWRSRAKADGTGVEEVPGAELYATTKNAYSLFGDLIKVTDPHGNTTRMKYDAIGRAVESHAYQGDWQNGGTVLGSTFSTYHSELDGNNIPRDKAVTVKSPTGGLTKTFHTQTGKPWKQENPDGTVLGWEYYLDGRPKKEPLSSHTYVLYTYDDAARQVTKTVKNATGSTLGEPQVITSNSRGQVISATDIAGFKVTTSYDKLGRPLQTTQPHNPAAPSPSIAVGHIYDAAGVVVTTYNALNEKTVTTHDALGRPILAQILAANGSVVSQVSTDYEPSLPDNPAKIKGQNAVQTTSGVGGQAIKSSVVFADTAGSAVLEVRQMGGYTRTEHDMVANVTRSYVTANLDGVGESETTVTTTSFDGMGRPLVTTMPDGAKVTMFYDYVRDVGDNIIGSIVERRMPGVAKTSTQAPTVGGLVEHQKFDAAGRLMEKSLRSGSSSTQNYSYHYHPANVGKDGGLLHYYEQQVGASSFRQHAYTYDDWGRTDTYTCGTPGQSDYVKRTFTYEDPRNFVTALREDTAAGYTVIDHVYDEQGRMEEERVQMDGTAVRHFRNQYDAAGRRNALVIGGTLPRLGSAVGGAYAFGWEASGQLKTVTTAGQSYNYAYQSNGLIASRTNPWRNYSVAGRDARGRLTGATTHLNGVTGAVLAEGFTWLEDNRQASYTAQRGLLPGDPVAAWTDTRAYAYDLGRRRLVQEQFTPTQGGTGNLDFEYDKGHAGLGIRTSAKQGVNAPDFQSFIEGADQDAVNPFARVLRQQVNHSARDINAQGTALGAQKVSLALAHANSDSSRVPLRIATHPGPQDSQGAWSGPLRLLPGDYTLHAAAAHPSGNFTSTSQSSFMFQREMLSVHSAYDEEGNVTSRTWKAGATIVRTQTLTWDGLGRLISAVDRDSSGHGYDWSARYDGLGRRLGTVTQIIRSNAALGAAFEEGSWYDPLVEFLEIAVETRQIGVANTTRRAWKVHGPDANGGYGGLQGIGGLEALVEETDGTTTALVDDYYGHIIANVEAVTMTARWSVTRSQAYGPAPDSPVFSLNSGATLIQTTAWRGRRMDVTGFYCLGARYYEAAEGRFLSPDPLGHGASMDLYSFAGGDPVNFVDPTGRFQTSGGDMGGHSPGGGNGFGYSSSNSGSYTPPTYLGGSIDTERQILRWMSREQAEAMAPGPSRSSSYSSETVRIDAKWTAIGADWDPEQQQTANRPPDIYSYREALRLAPYKREPAAHIYEAAEVLVFAVDVFNGPTPDVSIAYASARSAGARFAARETMGFAARTGVGSLEAAASVGLSGTTNAGVQVTQATIIRALRANGSTEALATAAMLKRGVGRLDIGPLPAGYGGLQPFGTNLMQVDPSKFSTIEQVAGVTAHEGKHVLQKLTPSTYRQVHEFEAMKWQRKIDPLFQPSDDEIWKSIKANPLYKKLKP